jgi:hypothetical protein
MYINRKMRTVETIPGVMIRENDGGGEFMIKCKKFCQCHNVPPVKIKIKGKYL